MLLIIFVFITLVGYTTWHMWRITPGPDILKFIVAGLFLLWMAAAFASMLLRKRLPYPAVVALYEAGQPWLIAFAYLLIIFILADIATLCKLVPKAFLSGNLTALLSITGIVAAVMIAGGIHYKHKYREEISIETEKPLEKPLTVVLASDLHIGYSNRRAELARWIDLINAETPDLVLFGGDIVDISTLPLEEKDFAAEFHRLKAPAYAVLGNHEYIGGREDSERFLADADITVLRDSVAHFEGVDIIGRDDYSNPHRAPLPQLAGSLGRHFTLVLDHQPVHLEEAQQSGIDFQFSGHTHRGQAWPISWVTDAIFEKSWGPYEKGHTQYYISSGLGIWGPKIRIGSRSEYLVLHITPME
jgi:predicted MPP superfamily phosphohydrolase